MPPRFDISNPMVSINQAPIHQRLVVASIFDKEVDSISDIESRLMLLGFIEGAVVQVKKKSFLKSGPLLVEVRGRLVALSQSEAEMVKVEVQE